MNKLLLSFVVLLSGCALSSATRNMITGQQFDNPVIEQNVYLKKDDNKLQPPSDGPITIAVYGFADKTGQRKSLANIASLSSAVTQGAESYLIKALQDVGNARWFTVLERVGLENIIKERQMIRQAREQYQGRDAKSLPPMVFAGVLVEGGIIGYDSNTLTGGSGVRILGIGTSTQYQSDTVTVNLRTVSVSTGEVLTSVTVTKTVLSYMDKAGILRFTDGGTSAVEAEIGASINESINKATNLAIQAAVIDKYVKAPVKDIGILNRRKRKMSWFKRRPHLKTAPKLQPHHQSPASKKILEETKREVSGIESKMDLDLNKKK